MCLVIELLVMQFCLAIYHEKTANLNIHSLLYFMKSHISAAIRDPDRPEVLIEGVLFRARYLGSTQLISEGQPSKAMRMMQAQEAVGRIKVCLS